MVPVREPKTYSILLADDLTLVREGLAALCEAQLQYRVVSQCADGASAMRFIESQKPERRRNVDTAVENLFKSF